MRDTTIARNYAEAFLSLARKANDLPGWGRISAAHKNAVLGNALGDRVPRLLLKFLQKMVMNRRQMLIPTTAVEYWALVDVIEGRVHARVTVARPTDAAGQSAIGAALSKALGKVVVPHVAVNPSILGGIVVRIGDTVMDGSVRRHLAVLRHRMLTGQA
jgi:F-type H+-transporting ATPase subunit delta